ncbi:MAG: 23S rRNA (guanosine(2251)-2'-O)-methyltransferase RlmB [Pseudomonadales bacterium]|jgi:23S rRNA (guanosine2251-2'-O)-methyltransferase|nr:23S rRNA (guanosine(2251)-2'-O)-methyltransferase RlmB [Pseudomonadales bacterium]
MKKTFSRDTRAPSRTPRNPPRQQHDNSNDDTHHDYVFGLHAVTALLKHHPHSVMELLVQQDRRDPRMDAILERAQNLPLPFTELPRADLDARVSGVHQGVIALCRQLKLERSEAQLQDLLAALDHPPFLLVLDGVTDPHNLGACLRSAEAAGVDAVLVPKDKSALITPIVRKVASGAAELVPFVAVTNLARALKNLQDRGIWVLGAAGEATQSLYQSDLRGPLALVLGSEGAGMRRLTREHCDALFAIPMAGEVSSLNVSVAAGICLFEAVRQRREQ